LKADFGTPECCLQFAGAFLRKSVATPAVRIFVRSAISGTHSGGVLAPEGFF